MPIQNLRNILTGFGLVLCASVDAENLNSREINPSLVDRSLINSAAANIKKNSHTQSRHNKFGIATKIPLTYHLGIELEERFSDNGARTLRNSINERQDQADIYGLLGYKTPNLSLDSEYRWRYVNFSEDTQTDEKYLTGDTLLQTNNDTNTLGLMAGHNQIQVLRDLDARELSSNQEDRTTLFLSPYARASLTPIDELQVSVDHRKMDYEFRHFRDFTQTSTALDYLHSFNLITGMALNLSKTDHVYRLTDAYDYDILRSSVRVWRNLRAYQYQFYVGQNKVDTIQGEKSQPLYGVTLSQSKGNISLALKWDKFITDVSETALTNEPDFDIEWQLDGTGSHSVNRDRIHLIARVDTNSARTSLELNVIREKDKYLDVAEWMDTDIFSVEVNHRMSRHQTIYLTSRLIERDAKYQLFQNDYDYRRSELGYRHRIARRSEITGFVTHHRRASDVQTMYDESVIGIRLYYQYR